MAHAIAHPYAGAAGAIVVGFGCAAYLLRWEARYQLRQRRRRGGFVIGGDR